MKLKNITYCGIVFNHSNWHAHMKKCELCYTTYHNELQNAKDNWNNKCKCGCGEITKYEKQYIHGHQSKNKKQTDEHKLNRLNSWKENGNLEKYSKRWSENNPNSTEENKKRLRENNPACQEYVRKKISENNAMNNPENRKKISDAYHNKTDDEKNEILEKMKKTCIEKYGVDNPSKNKEIKEKAINTYTRKLANGEYCIKNNWKTGYFIKKDNSKEWYDSSLELTYMEYLENNNFVWTKKHGIRIPYINNNRTTYYVPDFLIQKNNELILIETKGWIKKNDLIKVNIAKEWCIKNNYKYYFLLGTDLELIKEYSII